MLSASEAIAKFIVPVTAHRAIGILQKVLLRSSITTPPNDTLSATNILALFGNTDIFTLVYKAIEKVTLVELTDFQLSQLSSLQSILESLQSYEDTIRIAVDESKKIVPLQSTELLKHYNSEGFPFERFGVATFIIMAATL